MIHLRAAVFVAVVLAASALATVRGAGPYPEAISWSPTGTDVPLDTVIAIEWSMRMDAGSVRSAFVFTEANGDAVWRSDSFAWFDSLIAPYQSVATPLFPLRSATSYTVLVWPTATDAGGDFALDQDGDGVGGEVPDDLLAWTFVTEDRESPQVLNAVPTPGSEGVAVTSVLELQFSERMDTASVESALSVSPPVPRILTWEADGAVLRLDPPLAFAYGTYYTVRVKGAAARDLAGNALDGDGDGRGGDDYVASFVTEVDVNPPRVWATTPGAASTNVAVSANVEIRFSEAMNRTSVAWAFSYTDGTSKWTQDNGTLAWKSLNFADDAVVFNPYDNFAFARTFTVRLNASRVQDAAGFFLDGDGDGVSEGSPADDYAWAFTIETTDTRSPTVLAVDPPKGSLGAAETTAIALTFSEAMNRTSVEDGFSLASGMRTWTNADGTFAWTRGNDVVAYTPATSLGFDTEYALVLDGATVRDVNGNRLDGDGDGVGGDSFFAWFRTRPEPDRTPPIVVSTLPAEGAEDVSRTPTFVLTFDDAMDRAATEASLGLENVTANATTPIPVGHYQWTAANHTIAFRALVPLEWDTLHRLTVSQMAKDDA
ncbi:MAG: Ig-like domain-containing protein, partial [Euryarchaeota archaeon]|nr:Ig-like domain-containing protein [Euryarchaeota archaeon]